MNVIYGIEVNDQVVYVGKTNNLKTRMKRHRYNVINSKSKLGRWFKENAINWSSVRVVTLEECDANWPDREKFWIAHYRNLGQAICNVFEGGNGGPPQAEDLRRKIGDALRGKPKSREHVDKMSDSKRGVPLSEEHKRKLSEAQQRRFTQKRRAATI